jgi:hypothetical protein
MEHVELGKSGCGIEVLLDGVSRRRDGSIVGKMKKKTKDYIHTACNFIGA